MYQCKHFFHSHGKLLLTGEYLILYGALGLALPTIQGQSLSIFEKNIPSSSNSILHWISFDKINHIWFEGIFQLPYLDIFYNTEKNIAVRLKNLLLKSKKIRKNFLVNSLEITAHSKLEFPLDWGLGSSSTLINNISKWAKINPYMLIGPPFTGSGYDLACVSNFKPIFYKIVNKKPYIKPIEFNPPFKDKLFFLYLNKKQNTSESIRLFSSKSFIHKNSINLISSITLKITLCKTLKEFEDLLLKHEMIISRILNIPTIKEIYFPDYLGLVKSLGAWGGDFVLISSRKGMKKYFSQKGFHTIISFEEMII
ncbi:GYDIA family GHMP kinase [Blattabacterium cuenoti]|uniref:GYDIA family GHMP kinase n=1 Tax=Blattabacterium cuenoti TaxID=1653831 RepID=UPI00163CDC42|nr:GYDIA family GHMP kinase [Blattabacterium cuenoti]